MIFRSLSFVILISFATGLSASSQTANYLEALLNGCLRDIRMQTLSEHHRALSMSQMHYNQVGLRYAELCSIGICSWKNEAGDTVISYPPNGPMSRPLLSALSQIEGTLDRSKLPIPNMIRFEPYKGGRLSASAYGELSQINIPLDWILSDDSLSKEDRAILVHEYGHIIFWLAIDQALQGSPEQRSWRLFRESSPHFETNLNNRDESLKRFWASLGDQPSIQREFASYDRANSLIMSSVKLEENDPRLKLLKLTKAFQEVFSDFIAAIDAKDPKAISDVVSDPLGKRIRNFEDQASIILIEQDQFRDLRITEVDPHIALSTARQKVWKAFYTDLNIKPGAFQLYDSFVIATAYKLFEDILLPKVRAYARPTDPKERSAALALTYKEVDEKTEQRLRETASQALSKISQAKALLSIYEQLNRKLSVEEIASAITEFLQAALQQNYSFAMVNATLSQTNEEAIKTAWSRVGPGIQIQYERLLREKQHSRQPAYTYERAPSQSSGMRMRQNGM